MKLSLTRAIVDAIHSGKLADAPTEGDAVFGMEVVTACSGVPAGVLKPREAWKDKAAYDETAKKLANLFIENFKAYEAGVSPEVRSAGPKVS